LEQGLADFEEDRVSGQKGFAFKGIAISRSHMPAGFWVIRCSVFGFRKMRKDHLFAQ
jgi:hypothetical protein